MTTFHAVACTSGKQRYATCAEAHAATLHLTKKRRRQRPYRCDQCHGWHLTHYLREVVRHCWEGIKRPRMWMGHALEPMHDISPGRSKRFR